MQRYLTNRRMTIAILVIFGYLIYAMAFGQHDTEAVPDTDTITQQVDSVPAGLETDPAGDISHEEPAEEATHGESGGEEEAAGHGSNEVADVLLGLIVILLAAKLGGDAFERFKQPAVLGELVLGMVIGNIALVGVDFFEPFKYSLTLEVLAEIGVIILLFMVGLESSVAEMMRVGAASFMVATFGVIAPFFLGWGVSILFLPEHSVYVHIFIGATLTATSVGITARVLKDIGKIRTREAKIILGAAVIDDIMGLVILAVVTGVITAASNGGTGISSFEIFFIIAKAVGFVIGAIVIGQFLMPHIFKVAAKFKVSGVLVSLALMVCFLLAFLADFIGLAPIVGAFAAGLIMDKLYYKDFTDRGEHHIEELIEPISIFLTPIFFVHMGMNVDLSTFGNTSILLFAGVMSLVAIAGKQVCSLAIFDKTINKISIGLGMIPRGEVGLIFAAIGSKLVLDGERIIDTGTYSAVVIMVMVTTLVTPPLLKISLLRGDKKKQAQTSAKS
ncbi:MAG: cation:proton antiporter [Candidatus Zixiibacteriota bacterium]|nr:MAG: cation:proton antiporter [candidate division Zixibacteria bacterium]